MARSILGHNLDSIQADGSLLPAPGEESRPDEPGHAALALGEFHRATGETQLHGFDLIDLAARCITAQTFNDPPQENGLAYASLALLSFGPSKERNPVWERLVEETRQRLDKLLLVRSDYDNHWQAFNIAKSVCRFSLGLSKKDETSRLIDRFLDRIQQTSTGGFFDDVSPGIGGAYNIYGPMSFVFIRQSLQLHANSGLRERKLPSLRTAAERYIKLIPEIVREDGCGWVYGRSAGAYGQMHLISLLMQAFRDGWIGEDQRPRYLNLLRKLFFFFYATYLDQEHGFVVVRDAERSAIGNHTTRMANFDAARYLCQWSRLAKSAGNMPDALRPEAPRTTARFVIFDKSGKKEQGAFYYRDAASGLQVQMPLCSAGGHITCSALAYPQCPGVFDAPVNVYLPVMLPELTFGDQVTVPAFYGKNCVAGLGPRNSFYLRYDQPDLINNREEFVPGAGSCKIQWTFVGNKVTAEFSYSVKQAIQLDRFRFCLVIGAPHSRYRVPGTLTLGGNGLRCEVLKDDFQGQWQETEVVVEDSKFRTNYGKIHYLQTLIRDHPLQMRPGQLYQFRVSFEPDIVQAH